MELELNIEDLLNKRRVESDRIEFKVSWNPDDIYRSVCAFANDFDNAGGGYILVGVEEDRGVAVRPVKGLEEYEIDNIQQDMVGYNNSMIPAYFPHVIPEQIDGRNILVLWVTTGVQRPYKAPEHVTAKKDKKYSYYIRYATSSVRANVEQERELINMTSYAPFDTRPNFKATESDISVALLTDHLNTTKSRLAKQIGKRGIMDVLGDMQLLVGPPEQPCISNVALMMFCEHLDVFFPYTQVEITKFPEGSVKNPNNFIEVPVIKGSVPTMIKRTMEKLQDMVIEEKVTKVDYQMESIRRFSYPYQALEEAVVNTFYHRDYQSYQAIIIEIEPECVRIISYPGIDRSISQKTIEEGERFKSRYYRNKRLGEFLKELGLTEGKSTGIPTIQEELRNNGSPKAIFETDEERRAVTVEIPIHPDFIGKQLESQNIPLTVPLRERQNGLQCESQCERQNGLQCDPQSERQNGLQCESLRERQNGLQSDPQSEPQNGLQCDPQCEPQREPIILSDLEKSVLTLIKQDKYITRKQIASLMKVSLSTIKRSISKLKENDLLEYKGPSKGGYWTVSDKAMHLPSGMGHKSG